MVDINKVISKVEKILDKVEASLDSGEANSVWSNATRTTAPPNKPSTPPSQKPPTVQFVRSELEFVFNAAEQNPNMAVRQYVASLRKKYLGK